MISKRNLWPCGVLSFYVMSGIAQIQVDGQGKPAGLFVLLATGLHPVVIKNG